ncbi:profilin-1 [Odontesthes bonariensis]|uniref:profilin-1 n=1 Tax=Odontesthes bonariensis TaxID=219752 RepID=UPI003F58665A
MSWDQYITNLMAPEGGKELVSEAAICGTAGGSESVWAKKGLDNLSVEEIKKLAGDRSGFPQNGVYISGQKCRLLRDEMDIDQRFMLQLKTAADGEGLAYGVCVGKTKTAIIIAKGNKDVGNGQLSTKVYGILEYLRKSGY